MRIIGNNKDYYDGVMAYGQDTDTVFVRKPWRLDSESCPLVFPKVAEELVNLIQRGTNGTYSEIKFPNAFVVYIAGKKYSGVSYQSDDLNYTFHWRPDSLLDAIYKNMTVPERSRPYVIRKLKNLSAEMFANRINSEEVEWLIDNEVAIAVGKLRTGDARWRFNCDRLKDLQFAKVLDPYTIYQELSMWVGGVLPKQGNDTVEIADKDKIAKRGFDKWSFRKMPGG